MNTRWKFVAGLFLFIALAIVGAGSVLATEKKGAPGAVKTEQGHTLSAPLACSRTSGTCSCSGNQDCQDLAKAKLCDGEMSCQGGTGSSTTCSCKYKAPQ
jgi:hypothetical protein